MTSNEPQCRSSLLQLARARKGQTEGHFFQDNLTTAEVPVLLPSLLHVARARRVCAIRLRSLELREVMERQEVERFQAIFVCTAETWLLTHRWNSCLQRTTNELSDAWLLSKFSENLLYLGFVELWLQFSTTRLRLIACEDLSRQSMSLVEGNRRVAVLTAREKISKLLLLWIGRRCRRRAQADELGHLRGLDLAVLLSQRWREYRCRRNWQSRLTMFDQWMSGRSAIVRWMNNNIAIALWGIFVVGRKELVVEMESAFRALRISALDSFVPRAVYQAEVAVHIVSVVKGFEALDFASSYTRQLTQWFLGLVTQQEAIHRVDLEQKAVSIASFTTFRASLRIQGWFRRLNVQRQAVAVVRRLRNKRRADAAKMLERHHLQDQEVRFRRDLSFLWNEEHFTITITRDEIALYTKQHENLLAAEWTERLLVVETALLNQFGMLWESFLRNPVLTDHGEALLQTVKATTDSSYLLLREICHSWFSEFLQLAAQSAQHKNLIGLETFGRCIFSTLWMYGCQKLSLVGVALRVKCCQQLVLVCEMSEIHNRQSLEREVVLRCVELDTLRSVARGFGVRMRMSRMRRSLQAYRRSVQYNLLQEVICRQNIQRECITDRQNQELKVHHWQEYSSRKFISSVLADRLLGLEASFRQDIIQALDRWWIVAGLEQNMWRNHRRGWGQIEEGEGDLVDAEMTARLAVQSQEIVTGQLLFCQFLSEPLARTGLLQDYHSDHHYGAILLVKDTLKLELEFELEQETETTSSTSSRSSSQDTESSKSTEDNSSTSSRSSQDTLCPTEPPTWV